MGIFGNDANGQQSFGATQNGTGPDAGQLPQSYIDDILASQTPTPQPTPAVPTTPPAMPQQTPQLNQYAQAPAAPQPSPVPQPASSAPAPLAPPAPTAQPAVQSSSQPATGDLAHIKQEALQHLSPLVGHLDQSPEEKFHTTMMMLQATDDQSMVRAAFEAAKAIPDDKARAQALMDVVNEINYFTQNEQSQN